MSDEKATDDKPAALQPVDVDNVPAIPLVDMRAIWTGEAQTFRSYDGRVCVYGLKMLDACLGKDFSTAPIAEKAAFLAYCIGNQLDPLRKQVYFIKYKSSMPAAFVTSWEVFLDRAGKHPQYDGLERGIVWAIAGEDGVERIERGKPCDYTPDVTHAMIGGWARIHRKDQKVPCEVEVPLHEMEGRKVDGSLTKFWKAMPTTMATKTPAARALRQAFPDVLGGLIIEEESRAFAPAPGDLEAGDEVPPKDLDEVCETLEGTEGDDGAE